LIALPTAFQSAFQALQTGNIGGAVTDIERGFANLFCFQTGLSQNFRNSPNGAITYADTGQPWTVVANVNNTYVASATPIVSNGAYVITYNGATSGAGYIVANIGSDVTSMECQCSFSGGTTNGSSVGLVAWTADLNPSALGVYPDSPCHLAVTQNGWIYSTITPTSGFQTIESYNYPSGPIANQTVSVTLNLTTGQAVVTGANGVQTTITNPGIAQNATWPDAEIYYGDAATDARVSVYQFSATG